MSDVFFAGGPLNEQVAPGIGGPPEEPPPDEGGAPRGPEALRAALEMIAAYQADEQDDIDLADAEKIRTMIQTLLAKQQKEQEAAMGTTPALKGMQRAMRPVG